MLVGLIISSQILKSLFETIKTIFGEMHKVHGDAGAKQVVTRVVNLRKDGGRYIDRLSVCCHLRSPWVPFDPADRIQFSGGSFGSPTIVSCTELLLNISETRLRAGQPQAEQCLSRIMD